MKKLDNKVVLITGAGMGLGLAAAIEAAKNGALLSLIDYNEKALVDAKKQIEQQVPGTKVLTITADVSKETDVKNYVDETLKQYGRIDGFYNNAGIEGKQALLTEYDLDIFKKVIDITYYFTVRFKSRQMTYWTLKTER